MEKKNFVTMYLPSGNEHLNKDVGQLPYFLAKDYGFVSEIVGCNFDKEQKAAIEVAPFLSVYKQKVWFGSYIVSGLIYLLKKSKNIDVLNIYHTGRREWLHILFYKVLNHRGVVYIKLDCGLETCELIEENEKYRKLFLKCLRYADLVTVESSLAQSLLSKYDTHGKIQILYNGFSQMGFLEPSYNEKENVFLTVGNLSRNPKATDILLEAFAITANDHDWKLRLVGVIEDDIKDFIHNFMGKHPNLRNRIEFVGHINDRKKINAEYRKAKVFVLPSIRENFSLAAVEALANGCYLILSDKVTPYKELTGNKQYGSVSKVMDVYGLAEKMMESTKKEYNEKSISEISAYAMENFGWNDICSKLDEYIQKITVKDC